MTFPNIATLLVLAMSVCVSIGCRPKHEQGVTDSQPRLTYHGEVAEILRSHCADCHRPQGGAPFSLIRYEDAAQRATQIADVVATGYMPPWPPDASVNSFINERVVSKTQIETLQAWAQSGAARGAPPKATKSDFGSTTDTDWSLGTPDLIVSFDEPFEVPAELTDDIYRNFVVHVPTREARYVEAIEIRPSNLQVAHHLFVRIDRSGMARALSGKDGKPGFEGMALSSGIRPPDGCILSWQVGKQPSREPDGVAWRLEPDSDFVIECHLQPTGKRELLDVRIGLHFTDQPPTQFPVLVNLRQLNIDIPPGESDYRTQLEYILPVAAKATAVLPHAHFLGRQLQGYAVLPDGEKQFLISIPNWNFNWQGEYRYREPLALPAGTRIVMDYQFDNSASNPLNPNAPPQRVTYGPKSSDEMAELAVQLLPHSKTGARQLQTDFKRWTLVNEVIPHNLRQLSAPSLNDTDRYSSRINLAKAKLALGDHQEALNYLRQAVASPEVGPEAYYLLGRLCVDNQDLDRGKSLFQKALTIDPNYVEALNGLGLICIRAEQFREATTHFRKAIRVRPSFPILHCNLGRSLVRLGEYESALRAYQDALKTDPDNQQATRAIKQLREFLNR